MKNESKTEYIISYQKVNGKLEMIINKKVK